MSIGLSPGDITGRVPISTYNEPLPTSGQPIGQQPVPANAAPPVWQPWATTQAQAQSVLNTEITRSLAVYNGQLAAAQRMFENAMAIAARQAKPLETAAWTAFDSYMKQADQVYAAILNPAVEAYKKAVANAHDALTGRMDPVEHAYARAAADATWTQNLANGGSTL
jgi:hypothetical protein